MLSDLFDAVIDSHFIPVITEGYVCSVDEQLLLPLSSRIAIPVFWPIALHELGNSKKGHQTASFKHPLARMLDGTKSRWVEGREILNQRKNRNGITTTFWLSRKRWHQTNWEPSNGHPINPTSRSPYLFIANNFLLCAAKVANLCYFSC